MTTRNCGHCGKKFKTNSEIEAHISNCNVIKCLVCEETFDDFEEKLAHSCEKAKPVTDPEAAFRAKQRERKQRREFEQRIEKRNALY